MPFYEQARNEPYSGWRAGWLWAGSGHVAGSKGCHTPASDQQDWYQTWFPAESHLLLASCWCKGAQPCFEACLCLSRWPVTAVRPRSDQLRFGQIQVQGRASLAENSKCLPSEPKTDNLVMYSQSYPQSLLSTCLSVVDGGTPCFCASNARASCAVSAFQ
jgi:hypothetical protein